jgi:hypothetical protein
MVSKLVLASIVLIAVGLVLVVVSDPLLRVVTGTGGFTPGSGTFPGNFTRGNFTSGQPVIFRRGGGFGAMTAFESLAGIALVGAGLLLEVFSVFIKQTSPKPAT